MAEKTFLIKWKGPIRQEDNELTPNDIELALDCYFPGAGITVEEVDR